MCFMFASQPPESYAFETRSIRLNGQSTSIRLERIFWDMLEQVAADQGFPTVGRFISTLHNEVLALRGEAPNFTSHLRCVCLVALENKVPAGKVAASEAQAPEAKAAAVRPAAAAAHRPQARYGT